MTELFFVWGVTGVVAFAAIFFRYRATVNRDRTVQMLAEKGLAIPPELFRPRRSGSGLRSGVYLMCIGVALIVFLWGVTFGINGKQVVPMWIPVIGVFPLMIGVAMFAIALIERPSKD